MPLAFAEADEWGAPLEWEQQPEVVEVPPVTAGTCRPPLAELGARVPQPASTADITQSARIPPAKPGPIFVFLLPARRRKWLGISPDLVCRP